MTSPADPVLDVEQEFDPATSYEVRDKLGALIERDLLGPWDGPNEQLPPRSQGPRDRYVVGMLGPKPNLTPSLDLAGELIDASLGDDTDPGDAELPERMSLQNAGKLWASSMGLAFVVEAGVDVVAVRVDWGEYGKQEVTTGQGTRRQLWVRKPVEYVLEVRLDGASSDRVALTGDRVEMPGVLLDVQVRTKHASRFVELTLINAQEEPAANKDTAWLFQCGIEVSVLDGSSRIFLPIDDPLEDIDALGSDEEEKHLRLLYRNHLRHSVGRNVAVHTEVASKQRCAHRLRTTWLPVHDVPSTIAPQIEDTPELAGLELSMDILAELPPTALTAALAPLADGYQRWLDDRAAEVPKLPEPLRQTADEAISTARTTSDRIAAGIARLGEDEIAREAFRFANRAMALQRRNTEVAALREREHLDYASAYKKIFKGAGRAEAASWRPFQLAFVLLNLPALSDPGHPERAAEPSALVDLLFFPTGGGKTEAYLGLAAYTFAVRRLQGVVGAGTDARNGGAGVAVLMRYTLRLLTAQQFQRAAALVCAAEVLRRQAVDVGDFRWGETPFRIGLWVGGAVSPNSYSDAAEDVEKAREAGSGLKSKVLQVLTCPWCGEPLRAQHDLEVNELRRRVFLYCPRAEGRDACPFSKRKSEGEGLPIHTIDEEIYRLAPSLLIATVDKLAQLPWRGHAGMLFGRVHRECPLHGYRHPDLDQRIGCRDTHTPQGLPRVVTKPVSPLRPPDLIIQDELHLISGALGTMVGLFEAAVDELCTWPGPHGTLAGPKIVASTATTKRAATQVRRVFGRGIAVFPPQVLDVSNTFFSRQVPRTEQHPGRRYLGVCAHGQRMKSVEIRLAELLLITGQTLFDQHGRPADPYMTIVGYFNATRELAGMRRYLDDDVTSRVRVNGHRRGLSDRIVTGAAMLTVQELTSRISSADITEVLKRLEVPFDPELDTSARRRAIAAELVAARKAKRRPRVPNRDLDRLPVDAVLATSMLQVGVDVSRFGLMVVTGQPKNTAEYIQASSRVGRDASRPGLVITLYNWARPRDLAHFEDFAHYHATFYRQVEALSVTPYARRALDRGVAATFVAAVRQRVLEHSRNSDAHDVDLDGPIVARITQRLLDRAEAADGPRARDYLAEKLAVLRRRWEDEKSGSAKLGYEPRSSTKTPLRGLLRSAGGDGWDELTVGQSMRETEHEINVLLPRDLTGTLPDAPQWSFRKPDAATTADDGEMGDELGELPGDSARGTR